MGYHSIIPPFLGERAARGVLHLPASGWGQGHTPQKRRWQHRWGFQGRWESHSNAQTQCCTELLAVVMQCMMHLGRTEMAVKETRGIQRAAKWCMRAKRSVSWQIVCLSERQCMPGLVWSSAQTVWPARMCALTVQLGSQLESQHSNGVTGFAWGEEVALIKSLFSLPGHLFLQSSLESLSLRSLLLC